MSEQSKKPLAEMLANKLDNFGFNRAVMKQAAAELRRLEARVTELLEANNREVERRRLLSAALWEIASLKRYHDKSDAQRIAKQALNNFYGPMNA